MPKTIVTNALVIKVSDYAENDRIVSLLSAERGRLSVIVKGGRSVKYKYLPSIQLFTYSAFELYEKNGMYWLKEALVNTYFPTLCDTIEGVSLASYLADLAYELSGENEPSTDILRLLLNSFYAISQGEKAFALIKGAFELRAMAISGYMPDMSSCCKCGKESDLLYYFDVMNGCINCETCFTAPSLDETATHDEAIPGERDTINSLGERNTFIPISYGVLSAVRHILSTDSKRLFAFKINSSDDVYTFSRLAEIYVTWHLERGFTTLDFYKSLFSKKKQI